MSKTAKKIVLALLASSASSVALSEAVTAETSQAQVEPPVYSASALDDAWSVFERSLNYDAAYRQSLSRHEAEIESFEQAGSQLYPTLVADFTQARNHQRIRSSDNQVFGSGTTEFDSQRYGVSFSQPLFDSEKFKTYRKAEKNKLKSETELVLAEQELILRVAERYLTVLAAQDNLEFLKKEEESVRKQAEVSKARFDASLGREADYLEAKARLSSVFSDRIKAINLLDDTLEAIREISGPGSNAVEPLSQKAKLTLPNPNSVQAWLDRALANNLEIKAQVLEVQASKLEIDKQRAGHYPTLDLTAGWRSEDVDGSLFGGGSDVVSADVALQLELPLYQGGQINSRVRQAKSLHQIEEDKLLEVTRSVKRETRSAYLELESSIYSIESLNEAVQAQLVIVETKRKGYPRLYTSKDVLDAERDLYSAKRDWAKARYDYLLASLRLKAAEGTLSAEDLKEMNELFSES